MSSASAMYQFSITIIIIILTAPSALQAAGLVSTVVNGDLAERSTKLSNSVYSRSHYYRAPIEEPRAPNVLPVSPAQDASVSPLTLLSSKRAIIGRRNHIGLRFRRNPIRSGGELGNKHTGRGLRDTLQRPDKLGKSTFSERTREFRDDPRELVIEDVPLGTNDHVDSDSFPPAGTRRDLPADIFGGPTDYGGSDHYTFYGNGNSPSNTNVKSPEGDTHQSASDTSSNSTPDHDSKAAQSNGPQVNTPSHDSPSSDPQGDASNNPNDFATESPLNILPLAPVDNIFSPATGTLPQNNPVDTQRPTPSHRVIGHLPVVQPTPVSDTSKCPTTKLRCCDKVLTHREIIGRDILGAYLGLRTASLTGLQCLPIVKDLLGRYTCTGTPVCCDGSEHYGGLINLGCSHTH